ncbi:MAG: hypothetical protein KAS32_07310 [Candidatus Peribacteraceae bacterium]|nr:hypothetical protein [Candidatus Peribacteraceae bacterium]
MEFEKSGFIVIAILALFAFFIAGTTEVTGNITNDVGMLTNPLTGIIFLVVFVVSMVLVMKGFIPGNKFQ